MEEQPETTPLETVEAEEIEETSFTVLENSTSFDEQAFEDAEFPESEEAAQPINEPSTSTPAQKIGNVSTDSDLLHTELPTPKYASMQQFTEEFWKERKKKMMNISQYEMLGKTKNMSVPMARVKKIMRIDEDVRSLMIASDAPIFMAQAAEFFIEEMTGMGWQYVSESRRRILQKADVATAVQQSDQFDFLIDFLPPKSREQMEKDKLPETLARKEKERKAMAASMREEKKPGFVFNPSKVGSHQHLPSASSSKKRPAQVDVSDPATINLNSPSQAGGSDKFHCTVNETPRGNEFHLTKVGESSSSGSAPPRPAFKPRTPPPLPTERNVAYYPPSYRK